MQEMRATQAKLGALEDQFTSQLDLIAAKVDRMQKDKGQLKGQGEVTPAPQPWPGERARDERLRSTNMELLFACHELFPV